MTSKNEVTTTSNIATYTGKGKKLPISKKIMPNKGLFKKILKKRKKMKGPTMGVFGGSITAAIIKAFNDLVEKALKEDETKT